MSAVIFWIAKILINIALPEWNIVLEISNVSLLDEVIHLLVHSLDNVVADIVLWIVNHLQHVPFNILIEVPSYDLDDILVMIKSYNLDKVILECLHDLDDFHTWVKWQVHLFQIVFLSKLLKFKVLIHVFWLRAFLFWRV